MGKSWFIVYIYIDLWNDYILNIWIWFFVFASWGRYDNLLLIRFDYKKYIVKWKLLLYCILSFFFVICKKGGNL